MRRTASFAILVLLAAGLPAVQDPETEPTPKTKPPAHALLNESEIQWGDAPASLPPGAKMAVLQGDPSKGGVYTVRLKAKDGYKIPPHWHPTRENITVISGTFYVGMGDRFDESKATALAAGGFGSMPAQMHHFAGFKGDTEVQIHGVGPFSITYVNPKEDPRKAGRK
jgi:ChrR Cupin-like domain